MYFERMFDTLGGVQQEQRAPREYWVQVRINGDEQVIRRVADGPESACREFFRDLHRRSRQQYDTDEGPLTIEWSNVATLRVGPVIRVVRIAPNDLD
jgi:hypothetical protein